MKKMGRTSDRDRVLLALSESDGLSNAYLRSELDLTDKRYAEIKEALLKEGLIEKYRCHSGGVCLTRKGEKKVPVFGGDSKSRVSKEADLYGPLISYLYKIAEEGEISSLPVNTANLRTRGKWQNPDVTQITIEQYPYLRKYEAIVTTYEVKQWGRWDVNAVFEAASHRRFSHEAIVVLEWPNNEHFSLSDPTFRLDEISRECQRFGVGLQTMRPHYKSHRLHTHIEAVRNSPSTAAVETWLAYIFERVKPAESSYLDIVRTADNSLSELIAFTRR